MANTSKRQERISSLLAEPEIASFHEHAKTTEMSMNVDGLKASTFLTVDRLLSTFHMTLHLQNGDVAATEVEYEKRQNTHGPYLLRRRAFESVFGAQDSLLYGAANTGNLGTLGRYGQFCLVLDPTTERADETYVIPHNSLGDNEPSKWLRRWCRG